MPFGTGSVVSLEIEGRTYRAHWTLPERNAEALIVLAHGFARSCANLRGTSLRLMQAGFAVLCIDAPMAQGNPVLAEALARVLIVMRGPGGQALPGRVIVAGHSAGAAFAATLGATLAEIAPERLAGALLFDPVAIDRFEADLRAVSASVRRPVLAVLAQPHRCNAQSSALPALLRLRQGFAGVRLADGSTHADVEGEDSDWLAESACGKPLPANTARLRGIAVRWARDIIDGTRPASAPEPGADAIE